MFHHLYLVESSFLYLLRSRNGYGYRDTVQDIQGIIHLDPELAAEKIRFMLSAQVDNGGGLPLVKFNHNAGHENTPVIRNMSRKPDIRPIGRRCLVAVPNDCEVCWRKRKRCIL